MCLGGGGGVCLSNPHLPDYTFHTETTMCLVIIIIIQVNKAVALKKVKTTISPAGNLKQNVETFLDNMHVSF